MFTYVLQRLTLMIPTLIGVTAVTFFIMALAPGGFSGAVLNQQEAQTEGEQARQIRARFMRRYGLDQPYIVQYGRWLNQVSPLGFQMAQDVPFTDAQRAAARDVLRQSPHVPQRMSDEAAMELTLGLAAYRDIATEDAAREVVKGLADLQSGVTLLERFHSDPPEWWWQEFRQKRADAPDAARQMLEDQLRLEATTRNRVRFDRPMFKAPSLGRSLRGRPVASLIAERLPITVLLNVLSIPLIYIIALLTGIYAARYRGRLFDMVSGVVLLGFWSIPVIWAGVVLIGYLANQQYVQWFPTSGLHSLNAGRMSFLPSAGGFMHIVGFLLHITAWAVALLAPMLLIGAVLTMLSRGLGALFKRRELSWAQWRGPTALGAASLVIAIAAGAVVAAGWYGPLPKQMPGIERGWLMDTIWHLILPVTCLTYGGFAILSKLTRGSILENLGADFVRTARAKGVNERDILFRHVLRNSILPLITVFAMILPALLTGSVVVENIFSLPGMGKLTVEAAFMKDRELVMGTTLIAGIIGLSSELARDLCYAIADPRVSYES